MQCLVLQFSLLYKFNFTSVLLRCEAVLLSHAETDYWMDRCVSVYASSVPKVTISKSTQTE